MKNLFRFVAWTILLAPAAFFCGCRRSAPGPSIAGQPSAAPAEIRVEHPRRGEITRRIVLPATVNPYQEATLYAKVGGYVKSISVDKGDEVKEGAVLAELEVPELLADLAKFKADLEVAEIEHRRVAEAQKKAPDLVVPQTVDVARGKLDVARANLQRAETLLNFAKITAPFTGIVTWRWVDPGAFVPAATSGSAPQNAAVARITDFTRVRVQVAVPEAEAPHVVPGLRVQLTVAELPGRAFAGSVTRHTYSLDNATKTLLAEVELPNPKGELRPGMFASATIDIEQKAGAFLIPTAALLQEKNGSFVFRAVQGVARKTPVKIGFMDADSVEILEGLNPDDAIVLAGKQVLSDGQTVRTTEAQ